MFIKKIGPKKLYLKLKDIITSNIIIPLIINNIL